MTRPLTGFFVLRVVCVLLSAAGAYAQDIVLPDNEPALQDGHAARRSVTIGQRNDLEAEVLSGLKEGEPIVLHPSDAVLDGVAVVARS